MTKTIGHKERIGILASIAVIALGMFTVGSSYAAGSLWGIGSAQISIDEAAAIGVAHLNTDSSNLNAITLEKDDESFIYNLEFAIVDQEISMDIDPYTGEILNVDQSPLDVETNDDAQSNDGKSVSDGDGETNDD